MSVSYYMVVCGTGGMWLFILCHSGMDRILLEAIVVVWAVLVGIAAVVDVLTKKG